MFHLWVGMITGALLAYLWTRRPDSPTNLYRRLRWWLAGSALVVLLAPVVAELWRFGSGSFGPIEAVKVVLLPWAAGVGFGIWMFQIIRLAAARAGRRPEQQRKRRRTPRSRRRSLRTRERAMKRSAKA